MARKGRQQHPVRAPASVSTLSLPRLTVLAGRLSGQAGLTASFSILSYEEAAQGRSSITSTRCSCSHLHRSPAAPSRRPSSRLIDGRSFGLDSSCENSFNKSSKIGIDRRADLELLIHLLRTFCVCLLYSLWRIDEGECVWC